MPHDLPRDGFVQSITIEKLEMFATSFVESSEIPDGGTNSADVDRSAARSHKALRLETRNLSRSVGGKVLVAGVSVQVPPGEVLAVVGPSGAGKSSFLRLLNRLDEPTAGAVLVNGEDYRAIAPSDLRRRIGMVMQMAYLFPGTVAANIAFGPRQLGERITPEQIAALLDRVGLSGYQNRDRRTRAEYHSRATNDLRHGYAQ
jgi:ABC-type multidrug transport system fused ATPase/permease subunit